MLVNSISRRGKNPFSRSQRKQPLLGSVTVFLFFVLCIQLMIQNWICAGLCQWYGFEIVHVKMSCIYIVLFQMLSTTQIPGFAFNYSLVHSYTAGSDCLAGLHLLIRIKYLHKILGLFLSSSINTELQTFFALSCQARHDSSSLVEHHSCSSL